MMRLLAFLLLASSLSGQTLQNANFQAPVTFTFGDSAGDQWETGVIPSWTIGSGINHAGIQNLVNGQCGQPVQVAFSGGLPVTQDLGQQPVGNYVLSVGVCSRADGIGSNAAYTISLGSCSQSALNSTIPAGTIQAVTLTCQFAGGDMVVGLGCSGPQCNLASVSAAPTVAKPFIFTQPNCGPNAMSGGTCTFTFPMAVPPACTTADGATCAISFQWCDTATPKNCTTFPFAGELDAVKTGAQGTQVIFIVKATSP